LYIHCNKCRISLAPFPLLPVFFSIHLFTYQPYLHDKHTVPTVFRNTILLSSYLVGISCPNKRRDFRMANDAYDEISTGYNCSISRWIMDQVKTFAVMTRGMIPYRRQSQVKKTKIHHKIHLPTTRQG